MKVWEAVTEGPGVLKTILCPLPDPAGVLKVIEPVFGNEVMLASAPPIVMLLTFHRLVPLIVTEVQPFALPVVTETLFTEGAGQSAADVTKIGFAAPAVLLFVPVVK